eukprot:4888707-Pleurochrysis_carterae.AAC.1
MNLRPYHVAFIIVNKGTAISFASRCVKALAFVAPRALRRTVYYRGKRVASLTLSLVTPGASLHDIHTSL